MRSGEESIDAERLGEAVTEAGITFGRSVDVKRFTPEQLRTALETKGTSYVKRVLEGPKRWVIGSAAALPVAHSEGPPRSVERARLY